VTAGRAITIGSLRVDCVTRAEALDAIEAMVRRGEGGAVFTPNVDHVVIAEEDERLRRAYARVDLSVADGMPIVWASRLLGDPIPEKVSGSDLVPPLLERAAERGWRVYFLGGGPGVAELARTKARERHPRLEVVGVDAPRIDLNDEPERREATVARIRAVSPDVVLVALGAPKQEIWIDRVRQDLRPAVLLGVGASLDFVAGTLARSPGWLSRLGLEWLFRLSREPRRLWRRYLLRDPKFLIILGRSLHAARNGPVARP
jgi:N-acetylglucosaminyldiphosphoundecaprenol N-acetyl-beta-D-mannosaminyltransferase